MVECNLAKVEVAGSNPVSRSSSWDKGLEGSSGYELRREGAVNERVADRNEVEAPTPFRSTTYLEELKRTLCDE